MRPSFRTGVRWERAQAARAAGSASTRAQFRLQGIDQGRAIGSLEALHDDPVDGEDGCGSHPPPDFRFGERALNLLSLQLGSLEHMRHFHRLPGCGRQKRGIQGDIANVAPRYIEMREFPGIQILVGVAAGKTCRQMASRWTRSGKGKLMVTRRRRWKARSMEDFRLVVRIARPW